MARKMTSPMLKNTGVNNADEIRSPSEAESELVRCVLEARGMYSGGGDECREPNYRVNRHRPAQQVGVLLSAKLGWGFSTRCCTCMLNSRCGAKAQ